MANKTYKLKRSILLRVLAKMIVIVAEASYQMLQVLSFCDRNGAYPPSIEITVPTILVKKVT